MMLSSDHHDVNQFVGHAASMGATIGGIAPGLNALELMNPGGGSRRSVDTPVSRSAARTAQRFDFGADCIIAIRFFSTSSMPAWGRAMPPSMTRFWPVM
jgi:hypothetical protein